MLRLSENEEAVLELLAMAPVSFLPMRPRAWLRRLMRQGLVVEQNGQWFATRHGLQQLGRAIH